MDQTFPKLNFSLLCNKVQVDPATNNFDFLGVFTEIRANSKPAIHTEMVLVINASVGASGTHSVRIEFLDAAGRSLKSFQKEIQLSVPKTTFNMNLKIINMKLEEEGSHFIIIVIDGVRFEGPTFKFIIQETINSTSVYGREQPAAVRIQ